MSGTRLPQNPELVIRSAAPADCDELLALIRELAEFEELGDQVSASTQQIRETLFAHQPAAEVIIAEWQNQISGFALFFPNYSTFLARPGIYLEDLYVRPEFRGRGIGGALLSHLAALVIERSGGRLDWWVLNWNRQAIDFYEGIGARALAEWLPMRLDGEALRDLAERAQKKPRH